MLAGIANRQSLGRLAESPHLNDHTSPGALLQLKNWRRPRSERSRVDLGPINLEIGRGEIFGIFGPLGAGKTESSSSSSASLRVYLTEVFNGTASKGGRHLILIWRSKWAGLRVSGPSEGGRDPSAVAPREHAARKPPHGPFARSIRSAAPEGARDLPALYRRAWYPRPGAGSADVNAERREPTKSPAGSRHVEPSATPASR